MSIEIFFLNLISMILIFYKFLKLEKRIYIIFVFIIKQVLDMLKFWHGY